MPTPDQPLPLFRVLVEEYNQQYPQDRKDLYPGLSSADYQKATVAYEAADDQEREEINAAQVRIFYSWLHDKGAPRSALCFSGGGIRSATFGLGVLQGLARKELLEHFDFLSTVSGGGFLGSWLSAWIHRKGLKKVQQKLKNDSPSSPLTPEPEPVAHLRTYSNYMTPKLGLLSADTWTLVATFARNLILNWLVLLPPFLLVLMIPRFSIVAVRKSTLTSIPLWLVWLAPGSGDGAFWIAVVLGTISIAYVYVNRPSEADRKWREKSRRGSLASNNPKTQDRFLLLCLLPLLGMAVSITTYYAWLGARLEDVTFTRFGEFASIVSSNASRPWFAFLCFGLMLNVGGLLVSLPWKRDFTLRRLIPEFAFAVFVGTLGGVLTWWIAKTIFSYPTASIQDVVAYVCFAAPVFLLLFLLAATVFVGVSSKITTDADREWMARAGAWILIASLAWIVVSAIVFYGPVLLVSGVRLAIACALVGILSGLVTLVLGRSSRTSAKEKESSGAFDIVLMVAAPVFAIFILICLSLLTSWLLVEVWNAGSFGRLSDLTGWNEILETSLFSQLLWLSFIVLCIGVFASLFINVNKFSLHGAYRDRLIRAYLGASRAERERKPNPFTGLDENDNLQMQQLRIQLFHDDNVDLPKLVAILKKASDGSPHSRVARYITRRLSATTKTLIQADSRGDKMKYGLLDDMNRILQGESIYEKSLFEGIDLSDGAIQTLIRQKKLVETVLLNRLLLEKAHPDVFLPAPTRRPLHVINMTLNLVGGKNLAWQDRKAESFTVSALHSGSYRVGYRNSNVYGRGNNHHAISLGTAATISGAAVSPNMGYYASTFVTFLLALFNLRLGWWLGNPGPAGSPKLGRSTFDKSGPNFAARPLISETLGKTDDQHPYVYLSDGGHFENLGLYEMVLRRCKRILISDGSADADFGFAGLGSAVSKIRVDLGIPIDIQEIFMLPRDAGETDRHFGETNEKFSGKYCAIGTVGYSCIDGDGVSANKDKYDGVLIYIKAFLSGTEPVDIYSYAKTHKLFPHESTADQMYGESQFESYRALGSHLVEKICEKMVPGSGLEGFFNVGKH